jgi:hypothetical protein
MFIPDPGSDFFHPGSASKEFKYFYPKNYTKFSKIRSEMFIPDPGPGSWIWIFFHPGSRDVDPGVKKHRRD